MDAGVLPNDGDQPKKPELGSQVWVVVDGAPCHYQPDAMSPLRVIPPYSEPVKVIDRIDDWLLIEFCGKQAWSDVNNFSIEKPEGGRFNIAPYLFPENRLHFHISQSTSEIVEFGPRGGRFTRGKNGHRRYF